MVVNNELRLQAWSPHDGSAIVAFTVMGPHAEGPRRFALDVHVGSISGCPLPDTRQRAFEQRICFNCAAGIPKGNGALCADCDPTPYAR